MTRGARNPYVSLLLVVAGVVIALATSAVVVAPQGTIQPTADTLAAEGPEVLLPGSNAPTVEEALDPTPPTTTTSTASSVPTPATPPTKEPVEAGPAPMPAANANVVPTRVQIVSIGVDAPMIDLYKKADNTLEVPQDIQVSGWYTGRSVPGELGPSVVVGHVDSAAQGAGVFFRLRELEVGDLITIERSDGSIADFRVTDSELVLKDEFPTEKVYGSVEGSKLRLITCGGAFDGGARSYLGNVIVYAEHIGTTEMVLPRSSDVHS